MPMLIVGAGFLIKYAMGDLSAASEELSKARALATDRKLHLLIDTWMHENLR